MLRYISFIILLSLSLISVHAQNTPVKTETFKVYGNCEHCKERIEKTLDIKGIQQSNWSTATGLLTVTFDTTVISRSRIEQKLAAAGHDTENYKAPDKVYKALPECCLYERPGTASSISSGTPAKPVTITGVVVAEDEKGKFNPLTGATVSCTITGSTVQTDEHGVFKLTCSLPFRLAISHTGFATDTIAISSGNDVKVILHAAGTNQLQEVVLSSKKHSAFTSSLSTTNTLKITSAELTKAACCNLSESFETTPSVDVSYSDAVLGIKQIQLLGLSGNYSQLLTENIPEIRGLSGNYGLTFIPGPWIEDIQVTKGTGSVANGYESIAGQINIEEKKPDNGEKLFINGYANNYGRLETNINFATPLKNNWSTSLLTHINGVAKKTDANNDGFRDIPTGRQFNFINRWKYNSTNGIFAQISLKALNDKRTGGQMDFDPDQHRLTTAQYGVGTDIEQYSVTGKLGYLFPQEKYKSIGLMASATQYNEDSYYGLSKYDGQQTSIYLNLIFQSIIGNTNHKYRTGISYLQDNYKETFNTTGFNRNESVPGAFFEYTYTGNKYSVVAGLRGDYNSLYGMVTTPRLHFKYDITPKTNLRISAGSGFRVANIFAENSGVFISNRQYAIINPNNANGYGLDPEKAWNYGINLVHNFKIDGRAGSFGFDVYRTSFKNQVVVDLDQNPQHIFFYNLNGKSYSNSIQAEINYELLKNLDIRLAYRWLDVKTTYNNTLLQKPLTAAHRGFVNLAYKTTDNWKFDFTAQFLSSKRLPNSITNPADKQWESYSPAYAQLSAQVSKKLGSRWEVYLGGENLTGYMQEPLIIDAQSPFGNYFDGTITWGPVMGRVIYTGFRFTLK